MADPTVTETPANSWVSTLQGILKDVVDTAAVVTVAQQVKQAQTTAAAQKPTAVAGAPVGTAAAPMTTNMKIALIAGGAAVLGLFAYLAIRRAR